MKEYQYIKRKKEKKKKKKELTSRSLQWHRSYVNKESIDCSTQELSIESYWYLVKVTRPWRKVIEHDEVHIVGSVFRRRDVAMRHSRRGLRLYSRGQFHNAIKGTEQGERSIEDTINVSAVNTNRLVKTVHMRKSLSFFFSFSFCKLGWKNRTLFERTSEALLAPNIATG